MNQTTKSEHARIDGALSADTRIKLFCNTVARPLNGEWHLMNRPDLGWGSLSIPFPSLRAIRDKFDVQFGLRGEDAAGRYVTVRVLPSHDGAIK